MPRRNKSTITTEAWPALKEGRLHEARIKSAAADTDKAARVLRVMLENLGSTQLGRLHELRLPLPLRPGNRACAFLAACGVDATTVGTVIDLDRLIGVIVGMRFHGLDANGAEEFDFEPIAKPPAVTESPTERLAEEAHTTERNFNGRSDDSL